MARLKLCKKAVDPALVAAAAGEISELLRLLFGHLPAGSDLSRLWPQPAAGLLWQAPRTRRSRNSSVSPLSEFFEDRFVAGV